MPDRAFKFIVALLGLAFSAYFTLTVVPPLLRHPDLLGAFAAGFVNPYASGYAMDAITCWCILVAWIIHEARTREIKHGWIAALLGVIPGVAAGLAFYLLLRARQGARDG